MANQPVSAFSRTFANRDLFSGPARWAVVWSAGAAVLLACLLVTIGLTVGLLTKQQLFSVKLTPEQLEEFNRFTGQQLKHLGPLTEPVRRPADGAGTPPAGPPMIGLHEMDSSGILGSVWQTHGRWYGPVFGWLYRRVEWLRHDYFALVTLLAAAVVCWMLRFWCLHRVRHHSEVAALNVAVMFRKNLHRQALRLSPEEIEEQASQSPVQLFNEQVDAVRQGLETWIQRLTRYPLEILMALFIASQVDFLLTIQWVIPLGMCWFLIERAERRITASRRLADDRLRSAYRAMSEQLLNARMVRGLGMEHVEHEEFLKRLEQTLLPSKDLSAMQREAVWLQRLTAPICVVILLFLSISMGLKLLNPAGEITWPEAFVFLLSLAVALRGSRQLWNLRTVKDDISIAADQIYRYLDRLPSVSQAVGAKFLQPLSRSLQFDAVTFRTPSQKMLLDRVTLKLDAKKSYAVVSLDPLEAKTFSLLLPRFLEPQSGRVLVDGEDIAWATLESLRAEAVFVGGDDPPLRGTVLENLLAGNSQHTQQQATEAAKTAHAHHFIVKLPQGYETVLAGGDADLDASQRFRLSLARAVLRNPALLVIEEPHAGFDEDTKQLMDDTYQRILPGRTVVFLPARLSTLKRVDQIILLQNGQIAAQGTQSALISESPLYRHWEYLRFNEFRRQ